MRTSEAAFRTTRQIAVIFLSLTVVTLLVLLSSFQLWSVQARSGTPVDVRNRWQSHRHRPEVGLHVAWCVVAELEPSMHRKGRNTCKCGGLVLACSQVGIFLTAAIRGVSWAAWRFDGPERE